MANVIGYYGIDGEDYFDDNGNWKDTSKKTESKKTVPNKKFADKKTFSEDKPFIKHRQDKNFTLVVKNKKQRL